MGNQHLCEEICTQTKPREKFNKDVKIRKADFFLYVPQIEIYRVGAADISYEIYRAEGISCALRARGDRAQYFPTFGKY